MKIRLLTILSFISQLALAQYKNQLVLQPQRFYINSVTNVGGKNQVAFSIPLPPNTIAWYYTLSAYRDPASLDAISNQLMVGAKLVAPLAGIPPGSTELVYQAVKALSGPPGGNYCDVYLMDRSGYDAFMSRDFGHQWAYYPTGSRQNYVAGCVPVCEAELQQGELYLGIRNPDRFHGIHVLVSVEAVVGPPSTQPASLVNNASPSVSTLSAFSTFVGRWKDENSTFTLKADGSLLLKFDNKTSWESGSWALQGDRFYMTVGTQSVTYRILSMATNRFIYQDIKGGTVFTAQRFAD